MKTTKIQHKTLGITIPYSEFISLSEKEKANFKFVEAPVERQVVHNTTINKTSNNTSDLLGVGTVAACAVALPLVILDSLFDW